MFETSLTNNKRSKEISRFARELLCTQTVRRLGACGNETPHPHPHPSALCNRLLYLFSFVKVSTVSTSTNLSADVRRERREAGTALPSFFVIIQIWLHFYCDFSAMSIGNQEEQPKEMNLVSCEPFLQHNGQAGEITLETQHQKRPSKNGRQKGNT